MSDINEIEKRRREVRRLYWIGSIYMLCCLVSTFCFDTTGIYFFIAAAIYWAVAMIVERLPVPPEGSD